MRTIIWVIIFGILPWFIIGAGIYIVWATLHSPPQLAPPPQLEEQTMAEPDQAEIVRFITEESYRAGIPPRLGLILAWGESRWTARPPDSSAGAKGLFQLMPHTIKVLHVSDPYDSRQSTIAGLGLLAAYLKICGSEEGALYGYAKGDAPNETLLQRCAPLKR